LVYRFLDEINSFSGVDVADDFIAKPVLKIFEENSVRTLTMLKETFAVLISAHQSILLT